VTGSAGQGSGGLGGGRVGSGASGAGGARDSARDSAWDSAGGARSGGGKSGGARSGGATRIALLGSGGSIGRQTVDVLARHPEAFRVVALATGSQGQILEEQARLLKPRVVSLADGRAAARLDLPAGTELVGGPDALEVLATRDDIDLVVVATGGLVALRSVLAALEAGKVVATANKETLVAGGHLVMPLVRRLAAGAAGATGDPHHPLASPLGWLRPIDSEHSAIWQCLAGEEHAAIERLLLTASGGPFIDATVADLATVTPEQALRHPTWTMGAKITIDSATLANKGLEIIEARWLYDVPIEAISVVIHPQSVVHSAVQFVDGSLKAQLGTPDMRPPIQYALTYPQRVASPASAVDLIAAGRLEFRAPDEDRFPALRIAREAGLSGARASTALISADEVAVARFLAGTLDFNGIPRLLGAAVERFGPGDPAEPGLDQLISLDTEVRRFAEAYR
jgi:1-deoxy-D-xylulose-5-phosphate reductoisomerase